MPFKKVIFCVITRPCNEEGCPTWTDWTPWSDCSSSCGGGRRVRARECRIPEEEVQDEDAFVLICPGEEKNIEDCNTQVRMKIIRGN